MKQLRLEYLVPWGRVTWCCQQEFWLESGRSIAIGRDRTMDYQLPISYVSGHHATLICLGGVIIVKDNESTNGTLLDNNPVSPEIGGAVLFQRDMATGERILSLGGVKVRVTLLDDEAPPPQAA